MTDVTTCPVCNGNTFKLFLNSLDHSVSLETFNLIRCDSCELVITSPRPAESELGKYYISQSYTSHQNVPKTFIDKIYRIARSFTLKWKLLLVDHIAKSSNKTLLDYGCGTGDFIKISSLHGWQVAGIEPSANATQQLSETIKRSVRTSLEDLPNEKHFDVITLWHVLEHVPDLNMTLNKLRNRLTDSGTIFIAVPNHWSWDGIHYKKDWAGYDVPRHLWHLSSKNMKQLLEKNQLKLLNCIPMRLDAIYISLLSEKYLRNGTLTFTAIIKGIFNGFRSNFHARRTKNYSSLIYIVKK